MKRPGRDRSSRERVEAARRQAALALGRDPDQRDPFVDPPKSGPLSTPKAAESVSSPVLGRGIGVLTLGEAAASLGLSRRELEALIDRGAVTALPTGSRA